MYTLHTALYISLGADKETLFSSQELFSWWSFPLFLVALLRDPGLIL